MARLGHLVGHRGPRPGFPACSSGLRSRLHRAALLLAALLLASAVSAAPASAALGGMAASTSNITVGTWGVTPTATSVGSAPNCQVAPSSCASFAASGALNPWTAYFDAWNTGSETLTGLSFLLSFAGGTNPTAALAACSIPWDAVAGTCSGTMTVVLAGSDAGTWPVFVGVPAAPGAVDYFQATVAGARSSVFISTSVAPYQVATAITNY